jgi:hypothetical protein
LKNSKGVELKISGEQMGVELTLDLSGMDVKLKKCCAPCPSQSARR